MRSLQNLLTTFDRKERHALLDKVFRSNISHISSEFISEIQVELGIKIPDDPVWFLDYHIDWMEAAIFIYLNDKDLGDECCFLRDGGEGHPRFTLEFTQRDIDFLIYFKQNDSDNLIMIEAKYDTSWGNKQVNAKLDRLEAIRRNYIEANKTKSKQVNINFYYVLLSPVKPKRLSTNVKWHWIELNACDNLHTVSRCDINKLKRKDGKYWSCFKTKN